MGPLIGNSPGALRRTTDAGFAEDVVAASGLRPIVVAFGSPRSTSFKQLAASLARAVRDTGSRLGLFQLDCEKNLQVPRQIGLRSLPSVVGFVGGRPVEGFNGAQPDSVISAFVNKLVAAAGPSVADQILAEAEAGLASGELDRAMMLYDSYLQTNPDRPRAVAGLCRCLIKAAKFDKARKLLDRVPATDAGDSQIISAGAALALAEQVATAGEAGGPRGLLDQDQDNHQARHDYALALLKTGDEGAAIEALLAIIGAERDWNNGAAHKLLLAVFDGLGADHPLTLSGRRQLSTVLFS